MSETLLRVLLLMLYVPTVLFCYWRLIPRLSTACKLLATAMLIAQVFLIFVDVELQPRSHFEWRHWYVDAEYSLPSAFAGTQLMLVGVIALVAALAGGARGGGGWHPRFLAALGVLLLLLGREEIYEHRHHAFGPLVWEAAYAALGLALVAATIFVARRSHRESRIWYWCLLAGLAMSAGGALAVENLRLYEDCIRASYAHGERCVQPYYEESLELLGVWLMLVAVLGLYCASVPKSRRLLGMIPTLLPLVWLLSFLGPNEHRQFEFRFLFDPVSVRYESGVEIQAYRNQTGVEQVTLAFYAMVPGWEAYTDLGYSLQLIDQASGAAVAGQDRMASRWQQFRYPRFSSGERYYRQTLTIDVPQSAPVNRAFWIVLTAWRAENDQFSRQKIVSSDLQLLSDTQIILGDLVLPSIAAAHSKPLAEFDNGFALGAVQMPGLARPGEILSLAIPWSAGEADGHDYAQFLHFQHEESGNWWVYDQQPLGARLPTRLWYKGLADYGRWEVPLPQDLALGRYRVFTGLYHMPDRQRLPASDVLGKPFGDALVPLGNVTLE